jgi:broad specificity phosphatase PhoE
MTRFWWVRHGPTHAVTLTGWTDLPADLSDRSALERLAAALPAGAPVVSSDLLRARATADALQGARPRLPHDPRLREIHFGAWEGLTAAQAEARDPGLTRAFWDGEAAAPGGEDWAALGARVRAAVAALSGPPDVIVVAHFGAILAALQWAQGVGTRAVLAQPIRPLSLTDIAQVPGGGWQVGRINHAP